MKNTLKLNHEKSQIVMDRTFAKKAENTMSAEYTHLQSVRRDYPHYTVIRREIKKNPNKECWKGLTYEYMENYIISHEEEENRDLLVKELKEMILISECHSKCRRYPTIKKWFLAKYPAVAKFGMPVEEETTTKEEAADNLSDNVIPLPQKNEPESIGA